MIGIKKISCLLLSFFLLSCEDKQELPLPKAKIIKQKEVTIEPIVVEHNEEDREELKEKLRSVVDTFIEEKTPFDEPRTEEGQQDGSLRPAWESAWRAGKLSYEFNGDRYYVRSNTRDAIPPQVCADFIVDVLDRTGGNWWFRSGRKGFRVNEDNSFTKLIKSQEICGTNKDVKCYSRRVVDLIDVMVSHPNLFEVLYDKEKNGVSVGNYKQFRKTMDDLQVEFGDIVFIYGRTPWDHRHNHWHSFLIYDFDEEKNDWIIVGNAVMIAKRRLIIEGNRTPKRKLWYVFRPTNELLLKINNGKKL